MASTRSERLTSVTFVMTNGESITVSDEVSSGAIVSKAGQSAVENWHSAMQSLNYHDTKGRCDYVDVITDTATGGHTELNPREIVRAVISYSTEDITDTDTICG